MIRRIFLALVIAAGVLAASYGSPPAQPLASRPAGKGAPANTTARLDLAQLFPPGSGRDLTLESCAGTCHMPNFIASVRKSSGRWLINKTSHHSRFPALAQGDVETMYDYLARNFNPDVPLPNLPLELWQICDQ